MFQIFNGSVRGLGETPKQGIYLKMSVDFRKHLRHFKGAKLAVFISITLHADSKGWSTPPMSTLKNDTGYDEATISRAVTDLCKLLIDGSRVLLAIQERTKGKFVKNRYLLFPSAEEIAKHETVTRKPRRTAKDTYGTEPQKPNSEKPNSENAIDGINQSWNEPFMDNTDVSKDTSPRPANAVALPDAPKGYVWVYSNVSDEPLAHLTTGALTGPTVCKHPLKHRDWYKPGTGSKSCKPCPDCLRLANERIATHKEVYPIHDGTLDALCVLMYGSLDAWKVNGNPAQIRGAYNDLYPAWGLMTPADVLAFEKRWYKYDWRGQKRERPSRANVKAEWYNLMNKEPRYVNHAATSARAADSGEAGQTVSDQTERNAGAEGAAAHGTGAGQPRPFGTRADYERRMSALSGDKVGEGGNGQG